METNTSYDERSRLEALHRLKILDTAPEPEFDELVSIAAAICGAPISLVSLVDEERQWIKAQVGFDRTQTPRNIAFCHHAIQQPDLLLVEDAFKDPRFATSPFVAGEKGVRFYAGVPVSDPTGQPVGTLCVLDTKARTLSAEQQSALRILARQVNARFELRLQRQELEAALAAAEAARTSLSASEERFAAFMNNGPFLAFLKDAEGRLLFYNKAMARTFGASMDALIGKSDAELWPEEQAQRYRENDVNAISLGTPVVFEEEAHDPDGNLSHWRSWKFCWNDAGGRPLIGGIAIDVTAELQREAELRLAKAELEAANLRLLELANVDALTALPNRRAFDERLKLSFRHARHTRTPLTLLLIDIDNFKQHNDTFGHSHGDTVLKRLGECLQENLRIGDMAARYGGEEFAVLLPETHEANGLLIAERLLDSVRSTPWPGAPVTISVGLSSLGPATTDTKRLMTLADEALYAAKRSGKNRVVPYTQVYEQLLADVQRHEHARADQA